MSQLKPESIIEKTIRFAGGQKALAEKIGITQQAVSKIKKTGKMPAERVIDAEKATAGQVSRYELRPDIFQEVAQ